MAKQSYTKTIDIKVNTEEIDKLKKQLDDVYFETLKTAASEIKGTSDEDIEKLKDLRQAIVELSEDKDYIPKDSVKTKVLKKMTETMSDIADSLKDFAVDIFNAAIDRVKDMSTYDLGNSLFTNQDARNQAFEYGIMDSSQNYALTQAMDELGLRGQEDLMYMNKAQQEKFAERMGYWSSKYDELANKDFFRTMQEFQLEWNEFKSDLEMGVIEFFMQNKETIKKVMIAGINFMESLLLLVGNILDFLQVERTESQRNAASMEIMRNYGSSNRTNNVTISNTLNPASQVLTDKQMLSKAGELSYAQIIEALKG